MNTVQYHYAPLAGHIMKFINGIAQQSDGWATIHEWIKEKQDGIRNGTLKHINTITHGHQLLHGHNGRVDIYEGLQ